MKNKKCDSCQQSGCCPCLKCKESRTPMCTELEQRYGLKKWIFWFILVFVVVGFMGPFIAQCWLSIGVADVEIKGLEMWNQYVGIVLGIVATILSIVSLVMGFHSTNEAYEQQRKAFEQYEATIELIHKVETDVADVGRRVGQNTNTGPIAPIDPNVAAIKSQDIQ